MRINTNIVDDYGRLQKQLPQVVDAYNINVSALCRAVGISRPTYYRKLETKTFTFDEMYKICEFINR